MSKVYIVTYLDSFANVVKQIGIDASTVTKDNINSFVKKNYNGFVVNIVEDCIYGE